jgi:hypothetical protein
MQFSKKTEPQQPIAPIIEEVKKQSKGWKHRFFQYIDNLGEILVVLALFFLIDKGVDLLYASNIVDKNSPNQYISIQDIERWLLAILITIQAFNIFNLMIEVRYDVMRVFVEDKLSIVTFNQLTAWQKWLVYLWLLSAALFTFTQVFQGTA